MKKTDITFTLYHDEEAILPVATMMDNLQLSELIFGAGAESSTEEIPLSVAAAESEDVADLLDVTDRERLANELAREHHSLQLSEGPDGLEGLKDTYARMTGEELVRRAKRFNMVPALVRGGALGFT